MCAVCDRRQPADDAIAPSIKLSRLKRARRTPPRHSAHGPRAESSDAATCALLALWHSIMSPHNGHVTTKSTARTVRALPAP